TDAAGQGVAGAGIYIYAKDLGKSFPGTADASGNFKLSVSPGTYLAQIFPPAGKEGLLKPSPANFSIASGATKVLTLAFLASVKFITGTVKFSDAAAVTDAEVGAYSPDTGQWVSTLADSAGLYKLSVSSGKWQVGVRPKDPAAAKWSFSGELQTVE